MGHAHTKAYTQAKKGPRQLIYNVFIIGFVRSLKAKGSFCFIWS